MSDLERAIARVQAAPDGPSVGAFFDLDGTLVKGFTAFAFLREQLQELGIGTLYDLARDVRRLREEEDGDLKTIARAVELLAGRSLEELTKLSERVFVKRIAATLRPGARELVRAHQHKGHTVVMATAATRFQAAPMARDLDIEHLLPTEVEVVDGQLTGRVVGLPRWGLQKAVAVRGFAEDHGVDLAASFAYGNGGEDRQFLESVGQPAAVCPDRSLAAFAESADVPVLWLDDPPSTDLRSVVGTLASLGTFNAGLIAAIAGRFVSGGRWKAIGPTLAAAGDMTLRAAGIDVEVWGRVHLESARPAVFVINHQSNLDPLIVGTLVRHDFTGVGKQEVAGDPRAFAIAWLDVALIDRSNPEAAHASVNALVERIRGGESVVIWPE
ncbi:MAG: HAD-IB family hydrolase, partial [Myxococcota bacterium]